jgi:hypothetical protein
VLAVIAPGAKKFLRPLLKRKNQLPSSSAPRVTANSFLTTDVIRSEVDRYIEMPAQAPSCKIGEIAIRRLRAYAAAELGDAFILRDLHDELLGLGPVSLSVHNRHMIKMGQVLKSLTEDGGFGRKRNVGYWAIDREFSMRF